MANITFSEGSGLQDSVFGLSQQPIRMFLEKRGEAFEQMSVIKKLFSMGTTKNALDKLTYMTGMDDFLPVGENGEYPVVGMREGYGQIIEQMTWKSSFSITREAIEDAKLMELRKRPEGFITSYYRTRERFGAGLIGTALAGGTVLTLNGKKFSALCADGRPLFATNHPSILNKAAQGNKFSDAFSNDALMAAETAMQGFKGDNDEILDVAPDTIVIPNDYDTKKKVFEAIGADKDPATANNGFNYNFGRWGVIVWPYLNKYITGNAKPWILMDSRYNKTYDCAVWLDRVDLSVHSEVSSNDANNWKGYARFSAGFNDWRGFAAGGLAGGTQLIGN